MSESAPTVSIGLPVYNGENYLRRALDAIVGQSWRDFELIISDNLSTDDTPAICRDYAARDPRIRYHRNETNIGPCRNFDLAAQLARGEFFMWAAHDDLIAPTFVERCVEVLRSQPDVVLVQSLVRIIDENDAQISVYDSRLRNAGSASPSRRFRSLILVYHVCTEMFGMIRPDALRRTRMLSGNYHGCDRAMLAELSLIGRFAQIREPLFSNREHRNRYVRSVQPKQRETHHVSQPVARIPMNTWRVYTDYIASVRKHVPDAGERWRCYGSLAVWWFVNWNSLRVGTELIAQIFPPFYDFAKRMKNRLIAPAHPTVDSPKKR